jgi:CHRD domain/PEP-CTERM motif
MNASTKIAVVSALLACALSANAAIINLDLLGKAGAGLLGGNENGITFVGTPGSGGEVGAGIFFNDVTLQLTINIAWGSGNGFLDLTSNANNSHIHGPTTSGGTASFTQNANVLFNLPRVSDSPTNGSIATTVTLTSAQATELLAGRYYINVHTVDNGGGEIRGNIVPEPSSIALLSIGILGLMRRRR